MGGRCSSVLGSELGRGLANGPSHPSLPSPQNGLWQPLGSAAARAIASIRYTYGNPKKPCRGDLGEIKTGKSIAILCRGHCRHPPLLVMAATHSG